MTDATVFITGASRGIGRAIAETVPFPAAIVDISRSGPGGGHIEHLPADLSDPAGWSDVGGRLRDRLADYGGDRVVFVHSAGVLTPIGFAGEVDTDAYTRNVLLNSAAPQVLGHLFLAAVAHLSCRRELVMLSSGAAASVYPGWSSYGAGKAATDQWVRDVGAEQSQRGGVRVHAIAPGVVATEMQEEIRATDPSDFPQRPKFEQLHDQGQLRDPASVGRQLWQVLEQGLGNGAVVDLRDLPGADA